MNSSDFYLRFENRFRGTSDGIYKRLSAYDSLLQKTRDTFVGKEILDIGCGRGEWLNKCNKFGFNCLGIEKDPSMANFCRDKGFDIYQEDAFDVLPRFNNDQFNVISMFHVIEHLTYEQIEKILIECKRILNDDGILILETPSIDNLQVSSKQFYLDPTHITPINPEGLIFLLDFLEYDNSNQYFINLGQFYQESDFSIKKILNGVSQDLTVIASASMNTTKNILMDKSAFTCLQEMSMTTIDAAIAFDLSVQKYVENIAKLEESNLYLKNQIEFLKNRQDKIFNSIPLKLYRKIKSSILILLITIKGLFNKCYIRLKNGLFVPRRLIYNFRKVVKFFMRLFYKFLIKIFGKNRILSLVNNGFFNKKSVISDKVFILKSSGSSLYSNFLTSFYTSSKEAKEIYRKINKRL